MLEYFDLMLDMTEEQQKVLDKLVDTYDHKEIPETIPYEVKSLSTYGTMVRKRVVKTAGFALVAMDWVSELAKMIGKSKCLEIMGGLGTLSYALRLKGVDIICTDNFSWSIQFNFTKSFIDDIENIDAVEAVKKYASDVDYIICSWAPYGKDDLYRSLITMRELNPNCKMIVIGEGEGGCTADSNFFGTAIGIESTDIDNANSLYKSWGRLYDYIQLYR